MPAGAYCGDHLSPSQRHRESNILGSNNLVIQSRAQVLISSVEVDSLIFSSPASTVVHSPSRGLRVRDRGFVGSPCCSRISLKYTRSNFQTSDATEEGAIAWRSNARSTATVLREIRRTGIVGTKDLFYGFYNRQGARGTHGGAQCR